MSNVFEIVTEKILGLLDRCTVPWRMPWKAGNDQPRNLISGHTYRGINPWLLNATALERGFESCQWLTAKQIFSQKGSFKSGESKKYSLVVFWKMFEKLEHETDSEDGRKQKVPVLRYYRVYNTEQAEGIEYEVPGIVGDKPFHSIPACEEIVEEFRDRPEICLGGGRAYYQPASDRIQIPPPNRFNSPEEYYSTLFHELTHATGHQSRLGRKGVSGGFHFFGDEIYSREELVAEFGSSFLCAKAGIEPTVIENQAAYIHGWKKRLKEDPRALVVAAGQAQRAVEYILN